MAAGLVVAMPVIAQILAGFEFLPEEFVDDFIDRALYPDDRLDILFGEKTLGAGAHPTGNDDAGPSLG
jgi:hypothetical protein